MRQRHPPTSSSQARRWAVRLTARVEQVVAAHPEADPDNVHHTLMPFILYHFIECTWGACYNSIYFNLLVPHLDSAVVLDYVLRSPVVHGISEVVDGLSRPKIYGELSSRLFGVNSLTIHQYLVETFGQSS